MIPQGEGGAGDTKTQFSFPRDDVRWSWYLGQAPGRLARAHAGIFSSRQVLFDRPAFKDGASLRITRARATPRLHTPCFFSIVCVFLAASSCRRAAPRAHTPPRVTGSVLEVSGHAGKGFGWTPQAWLEYRDTLSDLYSDGAHACEVTVAGCI